MGDSDEEYDRRRARDKFRRERSDYQERRDDRSRRDDWSERDRGSRREYRDYDPRNRRDRYSPARHDISPPIKRMRRDWEDRGGYGERYDGFPVGGGGGGGGGIMGGMGPGNWGVPQGQPREVDTGLTQPPMMTFKQFLTSQDDGIDDQEAVKKYNEYKLEFRRQQINEFFLNHKDEEWFRVKYHPEDSAKRKAELMASLKRRMSVFMEFYEKGVVDPIRVDQENSEQIIRFLDSVVIKLEGGTDFDLKSLDEPPEEEKKESSMVSSSLNKKKAEDYSKAVPKVADEVREKKRRKTSRDSDFVDDDLSSTGSNSDSDQEGNESGEKPKNGKIKIKKEKRSSSESASDKEEDATVEKEDSTNKSDITEKDDAEDKESSADKEEITEKEGSEKDAEEETEEVAVKIEDMEEETKDEEETETVGEAEPEAPKEEEEEKPRALHRTCSIFLRYLAPTITKQEVEAMCKRYPGFLRVAIADPQPERRFVRRAWVTFERHVNIKEMCWNLNGIRLRDNELGAIVNRDLSRRIRSVNGIASHKQVVRSDIKVAAKIIQNLDKIKKLWDNEEENEQVTSQGFLLVSKNPLLKNITDYLIEEASAEEEELMGMTDREENKDGEEGFALDRDEILIQVLDRLVLYLRVVHSVDYYNTSEYPSEDEMPNRCGIMHARGSPPSSKVTQQEINEYITHFEAKSQTFLQTPSKLEEEECVKLGKKDPDVETEKFIQANTQELSKDKWLCPLSGKKFKGPEFVRKHIFNKHGEKVEEVKKEVEYFNSYLMDPKRPQLPEHPSSRPAGGNTGGRSDLHGNIGHPFGGAPFPPPLPPYGFGPRGPGPNFGFGQAYGRGPDMYRTGGGFGKRNYNRPRSDPREIVGYHDLDSPQDIDYF